MDVMSSITEVLEDIVSMLNESGMIAQAKWIDERRNIMIAGNHDLSLAALRELKRIIAGMGSLTDIHFQLSSDPALSVSEYNQKFYNKVLEFDNKLRKTLSEID
ncbi:MAG: hypothetical protein ACYCYO_18875 [Bacilli bacterium]